MGLSQTVGSLGRFLVAFALFCSCRVLRCFPFSTDGAATRTISLFIMVWLSMCDWKRGLSRRFSD